MARKSDASVEQRMEAVLSVLRKEESAHLVARRYGVSENTLYRWREQFLEGGKSGMMTANGKKGPRVREIQSSPIFIQFEAPYLNHPFTSGANLLCLKQAIKSYGYRKSTKPQPFRN